MFFNILLILKLKNIHIYKRKQQNSVDKQIFKETVELLIAKPHDSDIFFLLYFVSIIESPVGKLKLKLFFVNI